MGDKAILTEVLEASRLSQVYGDLTAQSIIHEIRHVHSKETAVRYSNLDENVTVEERRPGEVNPTSYTVDDAVELLGFGRFQLKLSVLAGLAWMADAMEMMLLSLLSPALACEWGISSYQQALVTTCVFSGMMLSSTFWGRICDVFGRRIGLMCSACLACVMGMLSGLSPSFTVLLLLRGMVGFGIGGVPQSVTLYAEFLPTAQRAKCVVLIESFWALGAVFEALLALLVVEDFGWRALVVLSSMPLGIFALSSLWLPESARFDMARGRHDRALHTLQEVARQNGVSLPPGELVVAPSEQKEKSSFLALFSPELRKTTILVWSIWCINAFSYYGMVLYTTILLRSHDVCHGGDGLLPNITSTDSIAPQCVPLTRRDYFDLLSTSFAEFPGLIITALIIEYLGRKLTMGLEFGVFAVATLSLYMCFSRNMLIGLIFIGRSFISGAFQCAYVYTPEVYPTTLRASGLGAASGMARVGAILTPFVAQVVAEKNLFMPVGIYGGAAILGVIAALSLPIETKGRPMKDTH